MKDIERRMRILETLISGDRITWRTYSGETVSCSPPQLFDGSMRIQILNADLNSFNENYSLLNFVQQFYLSEREYSE